VTDEEYRILQEEVALVTALTDMPGWLLLVDHANKSLFQKQKELIRGYATSFEDYNARCAWMEGASFILEIPKAYHDQLTREVEARAETV
jgi:hypothetical protein